MARGLKHVGRMVLSEEDGVETFSGGMFESETAGGIGLRIEVDQENATA